MGQPASRGVCCSVREKEGRLLAAEPSGGAQFSYSEVELGLEKPRLLAFAPLWHHGASGAAPRRLAVAGERTVFVYFVSGESDFRSDSEAPGLTLEYTLQFGAKRVVTGLLFRDEDTSRHLVVAISPTPGLAILLEESASQHCVRIWGLAAERTEGHFEPTALNPDEGFLASLDQHGSPVTRVAVSSTFLFTADTLGECRVWQKNRGYVNKAAAHLHQGGGIDLTVDRLFVYSVGLQDNTIRVWSVPDLKPVLNITAELPPELTTSILNSRSAPEGAKDAEPRLRCPISALTTLRRPVSRWSGSQGSMRSQHMPKGVLFVAGVISTGGPSGSSGRGAGVLMEWSLGQVATCRSAQIAHDLPVVALAYGPYDNGPLTTADAHGVFRIWDVTPRLRCSQRVDVGLLGGDPAGLAICVDPLRRGLFTITGGRRLLLWRELRNTGSDPVAMATATGEAGGAGVAGGSSSSASGGGGGATGSGDGRRGSNGSPKPAASPAAAARVTAAAGAAAAGGTASRLSGGGTAPGVTRAASAPVGAGWAPARGADGASAGVVVATAPVVRSSGTLPADTAVKAKSKAAAKTSVKAATKAASGRL